MSLESTDLRVLPNARLDEPAPPSSSCPTIIWALMIPILFPSKPSWKPSVGVSDGTPLAST
eukprot:8049167-Prorocentrum_lima.AAC.1